MSDATVTHRWLLTAATRYHVGLRDALLDEPGLSLARFELYLYETRRPTRADAVGRWRKTFIDVSAAALGSRRPPGDVAPSAGASGDPAP